MTASIRLHTLSIEQLIQYSTVSHIWQALFSESAKIRAKKRKSGADTAQFEHNAPESALFFVLEEAFAAALSELAGVNVLPQHFVHALEVIRREE